MTNPNHELRRGEGFLRLDGQQRQHATPRIVILVLGRLQVALNALVLAVEDEHAIPDTAEREPALVELEGVHHGDVRTKLDQRHFLGDDDLWRLTYFAFDI